METAELGKVRGQAGQRKERRKWLLGESKKKWREICHAIQVADKTKIISKYGQLP